MPCLPESLYMTAQVRELDRIAIEQADIPGYELMCCAGRAVFDALRMRWPRACSVVVLCGAGNNAGDGYVIARLAKSHGLSVRVVWLADPQDLSGDARLAWQACAAEGVAMAAYADHGLPAETGPETVIVDALLGTGLQRPVAGEWAAAVEAVNALACPVISVDAPSGIQADTGQVMGTAIRADCTVTFIGMKRGLLTGQAPDYTGQMLFDDLQVPELVCRQVPADARRITGEVYACLPRRRATAHKGLHGRVLIIGGNLGYPGAVIMAGKAALRAGAGLVTVATRHEHVAAVAAAQPELMVRGVDAGAGLSSLLAACDVAVIGPGLGQDGWSRSLLGRVLDSRVIKVIDADALNLLAQEPAASGQWVLTPHPGEAARLLGCGAAEIQADRFTAVTQLQQRYGGVIVLKGAGTLVAGPDLTPAGVSLCDRGNPGMATAGMGDILSGIIVALIGQGLSPVDAARLGVRAHAEAADRAAEIGGQRGLMATDLLPHLRDLLNP